MSTLNDKIAAEVRVRDLLEAQGLPDPDHVEYGYGCIRLLWNESKVALIVDLAGEDAAEPDDLSDPYP